jgi:hypothetical protein
VSTTAPQAFVIVNTPDSVAVIQPGHPAAQRSAYLIDVPNGIDADVDAFIQSNTFPMNSIVHAMMVEDTLAYTLAITVTPTTPAIPPVQRTLTSVSPAQGPRGGGTSVTLVGTGLTGIGGVTFGGVPATSVAIVDDQTITCVTPGGKAGAVDVEVIDGPQGNVTLTGAFTFV